MGQLLGQLTMEVCQLQLTVISPPSSKGSQDDSIVLEEDDDKIVVRQEREETVVPPPWVGTPMVHILTKIPDVDTDQSIDMMEDQFMFHAGVVVRTGRRTLRWC